MMISAFPQRLKPRCYTELMAELKSCPFKTMEMIMMMKRVLSGVAFGGGLLLVGCGVTTPTTPLTVQGSALHGNVHGGQQAVSGASIQLYAAGATGYGSAATYSSGTSLLGTNVVTSDANGNFSISNDYTCPTASTEVYLVATGGNPGLGVGGNNPNLALMTALGPCGNLSSSTYVSINEVTTVASVWALSGFMTGPSNIGTSATNAVGLTNAFATVNIIANTGRGTAGGTTVPAGATLPTAKLNTLADMLASCINSSGGTASNTGTNCGALFNATTVGSSVPTDTITAAMNMAQNPGLASSTLTGLTSPTSPFQPTVASMTDLSLVIKYTGGGLSTPKGIATDGSGNVWLPNSGNNSVTKFSNAGTVLSGTNGFTAGPLSAPSSIAVDTGGNAWVTNTGNNSVTELNPAGSSGTVFSGTSFNTPNSVAIDGNGNAWVSNSGNNSATEIATTQVVTNYSGPGVIAPAAIALDPK